jgi:large repetitive protein
MHVSPSGTVHIVSAGPCNIAADQAGNSSYNPAPTVHQSFTIAKATPTLHVTNSPVSYDGSIHAAIVSGSVPGTPSNILTGGAANQTSADTYAVTANFVPTDSTNYNSLTGATAGNFIINQVSSTTVVTCPANQTYTGSAITPCTVSVTGAGSLSLTPAPNYSNNTNVGTATASYTYAGDANHTGSSNSKNFTINNASQTITFNPLSDKTYGDADFTISANANSGLTVTFGSLTNSVCTVSGTDVHIVAQGTCTLRASQTGDTNYNAADNVDQSFNVAKKAASVTPDAISKTYGDVDPTLTGTLIGFLPADSVTATYNRASGDTVTGSPYTISATLGPSEALDNYDITYNTADFTINQKTITVTPASGQTKVYGESDPILTYAHDPLIGDDSFSGALSRVSGENVGNYTITQGLLTAGDNYAITLTPVDFAITAKPITVTADSLGKVYGDADPALTYSITTGSLVAGDIFNGALTRDIGEAVGTYPINQDTLSLSGNYALTFIPGTFTISAPPSNPGGPGDNLGCGSHDCSGGTGGGGGAPSGGAVLGVSTGPTFAGLTFNNPGTGPEVLGAATNSASPTPTVSPTPAGQTLVSSFMSWALGYMQIALIILIILVIIAYFLYRKKRNK